MVSRDDVGCKLIETLNQTGFNNKEIYIPCGKPRGMKGFRCG